MGERDFFHGIERNDLSIQNFSFRRTDLGTDGEIGFIAKWHGNSDVGTGEQEIIQIINNERIDVILRFFKPWKSTSNAFTLVENIGRMQTRVTWGFSGENKFPMNLFMLFYNMDKAVGKDFESGLNNLKNLLEKE